MGRGEDDALLRLGRGEDIGGKVYTEVLVAGRGGQGVLVFGTVLAHAALKEGREVSYFPLYGVEVRGGSSRCSVVISDEEIASPIVEEPDLLVLMDPGLLEELGPRVRPGGRIFLNGRRSEGKVYGVPASDIASRKGMPKAANMVMLGAVARRTGIVGLASLEEALGMLQEGKALEANREALRLGYETGAREP